MRLDQRVFHPKDEQESQYQTEDDRPPGWSMDQEWEEEQPIRISNVHTRYALKTSGPAQAIPVAGQVGEPASPLSLSALLSNVVRSGESMEMAPYLAGHRFKSKPVHLGEIAKPIVSSPAP